MSEAGPRRRGLSGGPTLFGRCAGSRPDSSRRAPRRTPRRLLIAALAAIAGSGQAAAETMTCRFQSTSDQPASATPGIGSDPSAERHCPVRLTREGERITGEELCARATFPKAFVGTVVANRAYPGNVIVLWANTSAAEAQLWAVSFERREVGVSYAFAAGYIEVGARWMRCAER